MPGHDSSPGTLRLRLAEDLLDAECSGKADRGAVIVVTESVLTGFHQAISPLVGTAGYEVLLGRAAILTAQQHEGLGPLTTPRREPPTEKDIDAALPEDPGAARGVAAALVCEFLYYLARLVGWPLALSLLRARWPTVVDEYDAHDFDDLLEPDP
jgi:hypothetical protein